ncbi:LAT2 domain-containing protein isoform X3 [Dunckerocampus dactyliophorus]|uniref:LAT2 domain-containing protein isoform X3 n=1 Tax=Dunckerocampus dactyliophorus TaxID=161453 RepID=UPI002405A5B0|nr:LAT2 domain-containing protein isoform X3 [Dunckerocampus dactyliophorus]
MLPHADRGRKESSWTTEGMLGISSAQFTVPMVVSLALLSLLCFLCLRCKKKSIPAETQIYNSQTFQCGGSRFAVMRSKTVMKANQITPYACNEDFNPATHSEDAFPHGSWEHIYVAPLPTAVYENDIHPPLMLKDADPLTGDYANVPVAAPKSEDDDDYENSDFLAQATQELEDDAILYVNEKGACT